MCAINKDIAVYLREPGDGNKGGNVKCSEILTLPAEVNLVATEVMEEPNCGLVYRVLLTSAKDYFMVEDKKISLILSMAVTAEVKTQQKWIIEYFLEPFKTYASYGLRER